MTAYLPDIVFFPLAFGLWPVWQSRLAGQPSSFKLLFWTTLATTVHATLQTWVLPLITTS